MPRLRSVAVPSSELSPIARGVRAAHVGYAAVQVASIGGVWRAAATGRRHRLLGAAVALVLAEGVALAYGRGHCPLGPVQERLGDPVPLFELFMPPAPARAAIPVLAAVTAAGLATIAVRWPLEHAEA
jgi:hypothetical protein